MAGLQFPKTNEIAACVLGEQPFFDASLDKSSVDIRGYGRFSPLNTIKTVRRSNRSRLFRKYHTYNERRNLDLRLPMSGTKCRWSRRGAGQLLGSGKNEAGAFESSGKTKNTKSKLSELRPKFYNCLSK